MTIAFSNVLSLTTSIISLFLAHKTFSKSNEVHNIVNHPITSHTTTFRTSFGINPLSELIPHSRPNALDIYNMDTLTYTVITWSIACSSTGILNYFLNTTAVMDYPFITLNTAMILGNYLTEKFILNRFLINFNSTANSHIPEHG
jgi:hypothetical protein